jgi:hypothetical protein
MLLLWQNIHDISWIPPSINLLFVFNLNDEDFRHLFIVCIKCLLMDFKHWIVQGESKELVHPQKQVLAVGSD